MYDQDEYMRGQILAETPPPMNDPGYPSFMEGRAQAERQAQVAAQQWQQGLDRVYWSSYWAAAYLFRNGPWNALKEYLGALISATIGVGLLVGAIAYFTHHNYERDALVGGGATAVLMLGYGLILFWTYWVPLAIVAALTTFGLYKLGIVPRFW
jgi:hypothetical protein